MSTSPIRIGSRGSQLALWQANHIAAKLRARGHAVEIEVIRTAGDRMQDPGFVAPTTHADGTPIDNKGIFIKEIEDALAAGRIDLAVHSLKDLPTELDPRFVLAAIPPRADARDAFVCEDFWGLHMLPSGARIGTTSPRRQAMLLALRPDLQFVEMRGNIDTRLRKWSEGQADALVLACAGLDRLSRTESVHQRFSVDELCPAPGQGALALETRAVHPSSFVNPEGHPHSSFVIPEGGPYSSFVNPEGHPHSSFVIPEGGPHSSFVIPEGGPHSSLVIPEGGPHSSFVIPEGGPHSSFVIPEGNLRFGGPATEERDAQIYTTIRALNDPATEFGTQAERAVLAALGGGCQLPLGAFCHASDDQWHLHAMVAAPDGEAIAHYIERAPHGISAQELGHLAAQGLIARGAMELLRGPILEEA